VVVVGADSPTLPPALVIQAFTELEGKAVVLGPATDGGYYLIGSRDPATDLFHDISWSGPKVLAATVARIQKSGRSLALLPPWYDVDTLQDWSMLRGHVHAQRAAGLDPAVPHTEELLETWGQMTIDRFRQS
jgi:glycosyltransferase A (GT-A) superfamily protein (DUF2064 family)